MVMCINLNKALIIFAKMPIAGWVKTRLSPPLSPGEAAELYRCMLEDILAKTSRLAGIRKYLFHEGGVDAGRYFAGTVREMTCLPQQGSDLGERMANAFRHVFAEGCTAAAIIGTDSPDLPVSRIDTAYELLEKGDVVLGPSEDGGYYLLGMRKMYAGLFHDILWSSANVLRESLRKAEDAGITVSLLPTWHDVDTAEDLRRPQLLDEENGAPLTRAFIGNWLKQREET
jgi:uncharacterized protein